MAIEKPIASPMKMVDKSGDKKEVRTIRASEYLSVKHALPKTNVTNVILYENTSQDRHLDMLLSHIKHRKERTANICESQMRAFLLGQEKKLAKWKRDDEVRLNAMNLPHLERGGSGSGRPHSMMILYRNADYQTMVSPRESNGRAKQPTLPPLVAVRREQTEIIAHKEKTFITKLPTKCTVNPLALQHHVTYCGAKNLKRNVASQDTRFQKLSRSLENSTSTEAKTDRVDYQSSSRPVRRFTKFPNRQMATRKSVFGQQASLDGLKGLNKDVETKSSTLMEREYQDFKSTDVKDIVRELTKLDHA